MTTIAVGLTFFFVDLLLNANKGNSKTRTKTSVTKIYFYSSYNWVIRRIKFPQIDGKFLYLSKQKSSMLTKAQKKNTHS